MKARHFPNLMIIVWLLSACATPLGRRAEPYRSVEAPPAATTSTPTPTATESPTPTPLTSTALSASPPTPEYVDELTYDPAAHTLNDPQGAPVFALDESGVWLVAAARRAQDLPPGPRQVAMHTGAYAGWFEQETADGGTFTAEEEAAYLADFQTEFGVEVVHSQTADGLVSSFAVFTDPHTKDRVALWAVNDDNLLLGARPDVPGAENFHFGELRLPKGFELMAVDHVVFAVDADSKVPVAWVDPIAGQDNGLGEIVKALKIINPDGTAGSLQVIREGGQLAALNGAGEAIARIDANSNGWGEAAVEAQTAGEVEYAPGVLGEPPPDEVLAQLPEGWRYGIGKNNRKQVEDSFGNPLRVKHIGDEWAVTPWGLSVAIDEAKYAGFELPAEREWSFANNNSLDYMYTYNEAGQQVEIDRLIFRGYFVAAELVKLRMTTGRVVEVVSAIMAFENQNHEVQFQRIILPDTFFANWSTPDVVWSPKVFADELMAFIEDWINTGEQVSLSVLRDYQVTVDEGEDHCPLYWSDGTTPQDDCQVERDLTLNVLDSGELASFVATAGLEGRVPFLVTEVIYKGEIPPAQDISK